MGLRARVTKTVTILGEDEKHVELRNVDLVVLEHFLALARLHGAPSDAKLVTDYGMTYVTWEVKGKP